MISQDAPTVTDELIAELEAAANAATPGPYRQCGADTESKSCACGQIWSTATDELVAFAHNGDAIIDSPAAGQAANSQFFAAANPAIILALLAERADLRQQLSAASITAENCETFRRNAERYIWLRDKANWVKGDAPQVVITDWLGLPVSIYPRAYPQGETLDAAIDAARNIGSGD